MRLSAKILKNVNNVNSWKFTSQCFVQEGQANVVYIQLVDLDQSTSIANEKSAANPEHPIRYISQATVVSAVALFDALETDSQFSVTGTQPFASDKSIFKFDLTAAQVPNSGNLTITLTEDGISKKFIVRSAISVETLNIGGC